MALLQPVVAEWQENFGQNAHAISMSKMCTSCDNPNTHTYGLRVVIPEKGQEMMK